MKRRGFLTQTAAVLAAIGLGELGLEAVDAETLGAQWQAVAAAGGRRFALLVGIDRYDNGSSKLANLSGCEQDVMLQQQLLQHRFGFAPENITTLVDDAATGDRFDAELKRLAVKLAPSDALVVHFSGYGTQLVSPASDMADSTAESPTASSSNAKQSAIVFADRRPYALDNLSERLGSLSTRNAIATIDASYVLPATSCRKEVRARVVPESQVDRDAPIGFAQSLAAKRRNPPSSRPTVITYDRNGLAAERRYSDFTAGVLTYALTQMLWHLTPSAPWSEALAMALVEVERMGGSPLFLQTRASRSRTPWSGKSIELDIRPTIPASAIGAIVGTDFDRAGTFDVWLGGFTSTVLSNYSAGSILTYDRQVLDRPPASVLPIPARPDSEADGSNASEASAASSGAESESATRPEAKSTAANPGEDRRSWLRIERSRGLKRSALPLQQAPTDAAIGNALFEVVRVLPRSLQLGVALDSQLPRIERVDATSALSGLRGIEAISSADREADCWFGCASNCDLPDTSDDSEAEVRKRYTLLSFTRQPIFDCITETDAAIKRTIRNLEPRLQDLRAFKILSATENSNTSMLAVRVTYGLAKTDPTVPDRGLRRVCQTTAIPTANASRDRSTLQLASGSRVQYRIENLGDRPLYVLLVRLDACGRLSIPDTDERIARPRDVLSVPDRPEATAWNVERDPGLVRLFAILSDRPFENTRATLTENHAT